MQDLTPEFQAKAREFCDRPDQPTRAEFVAECERRKRAHHKESAETDFVEQARYGAPRRK